MDLRLNQIAPDTWLVAPKGTHAVTVYETYRELTKAGISRGERSVDADLAASDWAMRYLRSHANQWHPTQWLHERGYLPRQDQVVRLRYVIDNPDDAMLFKLTFGGQ